MSSTDKGGGATVNVSLLWNIPEYYPTGEEDSIGLCVGECYSHIYSHDLGEVS